MAGTQAPLPGSEVALIGLAALNVVMISFLWSLANQLIETEHAAFVPWITAVLLVLLHSLLHRSFGVISVLAAIELLAVVIRYEDGGLEEVIVYAANWLLLSGARNAIAHRAGAGMRATSAGSPTSPAGARQTG